MLCLVHTSRPTGGLLRYSGAVTPRVYTVQSMQDGAGAVPAERELHRWSTRYECLHT